MPDCSCNRRLPARTRREFLERSSFGFGALALGYLSNHDATAATSADPLAPKQPQFSARAKHVIFIFMQGGLSHMDTFDPKPLLNRLNGQPLPPSFQKQDLALAQINAKESLLMGSRQVFKKYGQSGLEVSDLFQNVG